MGGDTSAVKRRIRAAMVLAGLSIDGLAQRMDQEGLRARTVRKLQDENDERVPRRHELTAIAEAADVPLWFLERGLEPEVGEVAALAGRVGQVEDELAELRQAREQIEALGAEVKRLRLGIADAMGEHVEDHVAARQAERAAPPPDESGVGRRPRRRAGR